MVIDKKCSTILLKIIEKEEPITVKALSESLNVSERAVRYNFNKLDDWLKSKALDTLVRIPGKGITIHEAQKKTVQSLLNNIDEYAYVNSSEERKKIISLKFLDSKEPITIKEMEQDLLISKNTLIKELKSLKIWFHDRGVELVSKPRVGYFLKGEENRKRTAVKELMTQIYEKDKAIDMIKIINGKGSVDNGLSKELKSLFQDIDINYIEACVKHVENLLEKEFIYNSYINLITHIAIAIKRLKDNQEIKMDGSNLNRIKTFVEYHVADKLAKKLEMKFKIRIPEDEVGYIAMHLVGTKIYKDLNHQYESEPISELTWGLIENFEKEYGIVLRNKANLAKNLILHLRPAIYRLKFGVQIHNPILMEIKIKYKDIFLTLKNAVRRIEEQFDIKANDDEIGYLAMHFGSALQLQENHEGRKINVLVICGSGVGTAKLLEAQLRIKFPQINVVDTISSLNRSKYLHQDINFIISTIYIEDERIPTIVVSPLLNIEDCRLIQKTLHITQREKRNDVDDTVIEIMNAITNHSKVENYEQLQNEITYILKNRDRTTNKHKGGKPMLRDLLTKDTVILNAEATDWENAVYIGGEILLNKGHIEKRYIHNMISKIKEIGPFVVIAPGVALPHARPEEGVKELSMSLMTLKEPVNFGNKDNDPVKLVITLAAIDNETHLKALSQLMGVLCHSENITNIINAVKEEEVLKIIEAYSK